MIHSHYIASGNGDLFPLLFIIVAVIAQIIKAVKGARPTIDQPENNTTPGGGRFDSPEDELRKFLEGLSGKQAEPATEPPKPPPVPTPQPQRRSALRQAIVKPPEPQTVTTTQESVHAESAFIQAPATQPEKQSSEPASYEISTSHEKHSCTGLRFLQRDNPAELKRAIILREVLGPCLALQQMER